ncbi:class I SAM-dependent methyltransferase [Stappia stellulata]|uniref:class I SAM-dependent methyltransferase n=1 Tax=Stappia stellulata TaxID=71235 RepID=UPI0004298E6E|nr:class I SAM-dependent methyltransferase [Stappia stellulata]
MKLFRVIKHALWKAGFMRRTGAPFWVVRAHFLSDYFHKHFGGCREAGRRHRRARDDFRRSSRHLDFDDDWFSGSVPTLLRAVDKAGLGQREGLNCLEIGCWQGLSTNFFLTTLSGSRWTCVDTWAGSDEHKSGRCATQQVLAQVEDTFDANLSGFRGRYAKHKGTSLSFYSLSAERGPYDLIFIDGSHHSDDVIVDAVKCFEMLRDGGLLIFDDYFWTYYEREMDNPAAAINAFLRLKRQCLEIVCFDYQLIVRKLSSSSRRDSG